MFPVCLDWRISLSYKRVPLCSIGFDFILSSEFIETVAECLGMPFLAKRGNPCWIGTGTLAG